MPAKLRETPAQPWRASALQNFGLACITLLGQSSKTGVVSELKDQSEQGWDLIEPAAAMELGLLRLDPFFCSYRNETAKK